MAADFKATAYIEINHPKDFIQRWRKALPTDAQGFAERVKYYTAQTPPVGAWADPVNIATSKLSKFNHQREYRLVYAKTDALQLLPTNIRITKREARSLPDPTQHKFEIISLGDLSDICTMHRI